jgi:hypothetical protein
MSSSTQSHGSSLARKALILIVYMVEVTLMVFAGLSMFRVVAAENWWTLAINIFQVALTSFVWWMMGRGTHFVEAAFLLVSLVSALLMTVLRSVWQGVSSGDDAEEVSETSERDLKMTYIGLANTRTIVFLIQTVLLLLMFLYTFKRAPSRPK